MKVLAGIAAAVVLCLVLLVVAVRASGPGTGVLSLSGAEADIPLCSTFEPVEVGSLVTDERPACTPHGVPLVFPDGATLDLPEQDPGTGATTVGQTTYSYVGVGVFGLYASRAGADCDAADEWGSAEAIARVHEAFGDDYACRGA
ncbi:hypothetical protein EDF38_0451 [Frigoribacterium sp. PhB160]|uniref:hypothetical protein n=1 Tax=Frigoribacterium sp. PhB160 TaxID=2485192 RepID=UPI000F4A66B8|nr:hypothetical protein [Frigoribacterium sp. PhB160]ROS61362.1 hypothetical protein EDF38_0451 [Frigoribacterium sp. PhB160]